MELARAVDEELDKENVAPPAVSKPGGKLHAPGVNEKLSDDDSTDCFIVESSTSEQSARASPLPGILSSSTLAHVEGKEEEEEEEAAGEAVMKKKRKKKKKKKKKKTKMNGEEEKEEVKGKMEAAGPEKETKEDKESEVIKKKEESFVSKEDVESAAAEKAEGEEAFEGEEEDEEGEIKDTEAMEVVDSEVGEAKQRQEAEPQMEEEEPKEHESGIEEHQLEAERAEMKEEELEEGESGIEEQGAETAPTSFDLLAHDAAILAVGRRPLIELGSSSEESEPEHRPVYDEEYVTVDEEAPNPLSSVAEPEDGEVEEEAVPEPSAEDAEPFEEPSAEMMARIVKQIEFYFSDANILKDYFLLRRVRKNREGWVRISLLANFKLVQSITKDCRQVAFALKHKSTLLETDEAGLRVRRRGGLPTWDHHVYKRTCLIYGFDRHPPRRGARQKVPATDSVSVQFIRDKLLSKFASQLLLVRVLKPGKDVPLDLKTCVRNHPQLGQELCVVVEFDTVPAAEAARSFVDGRRWSQSHRLWAKILGKRPRLPEEWAARFGAQRAELLKQQHQQQQSFRGSRCDPAFHQHQQQQAFYQRQLLQQLYYQQQQQKFLEELQRRRWGDKKISYADSVRGKKRPAPESYADKVRGSGAKSDAEAAPPAAELPEKEEKRKLAARVRARPKKGAAKKGHESDAGASAQESATAKAAKPKPVSYAAAASVVRSSSSGEVAKTKEAKRDGATQTAATTSTESAAPSDRKPRSGLLLLREPRAPNENGASWVRRRNEAEAEAETGAGTGAKADEKGAETDEKGTEIGENGEATAVKSGGLARRRSVRELVRQFEALTASANESDEPGSAQSTPRRVSVTPRGPLGGVPEL